ncbi:LuxR C-terminal-related transcriptional regulator [Streptomyces sp. NPDC096323]|uniref:LuxR C-terminal-related transcriptional regulator n=1 Tax=Streptomyces sp. NPDC096323 TaxID=3155822 RepID=UPI003332D220
MEDNETHERTRLLYAHALRDPDWDPHAFADAQSWSNDQVTQAILHLADLQLLCPNPHAPSGWAAAAPSGALGHLLAHGHRTVDGLTKELHQVWNAVSRVIADYHPVHADQLAHTSTELLTGVARVTAALEDITRSAKQEIVSLHPGKAVPPEMIEEGLARDRQALAKGIRIRTVHLHTTACTPHMAAYLDDLQALGGKVKTTQMLPLRMIVVDGTSAMVPAPAPEGELAALLVHGGPLAAVFLQMFEHCWVTSAPLPLSGPRAADHSKAGLGDRESTVLALLATGATDESIARRLGASERTVRRIVAELMEQLGATSRFEAGVLATRSGWLGPLHAEPSPEPARSGSVR